MSTTKAEYVALFYGYTLGDLSQYAIEWDCSIETAIDKLYDQLPKIE